MTVLLLLTFLYRRSCSGADANADRNGIDLIRRRHPVSSGSDNATLSSASHLASASTFSAVFHVAINVAAANVTAANVTAANFNTDAAAFNAFFASASSASSTVLSAVTSNPFNLALNPATAFFSLAAAGAAVVVFLTIIIRYHQIGRAHV